ncbi:hypothetical protein DB346_08445 [Verrucomicrobia bacterium LW23]|nr:hypothetical protein DB346_08445 [Verrucomicrobia bacterium LW23]
MRITINNYELANDVDALVVTGPDQFDISGVDAEQMVQLIRGASTQFYDRENRQTTMSFTVSRLHASLMAAEFWLITHERDVPRRGLVTIRVRNPSGGQEASAYLAGAMLTPRSGYSGLTTLHTYQLRGGVFLSSPPSS